MSSFDDNQPSSPIDPSLEDNNNNNNTSSNGDDLNQNNVDEIINEDVNFDQKLDNEDIVENKSLSLEENLGDKVEKKDEIINNDDMIKEEDKQLDSENTEHLDNNEETHKLIGEEKLKNEEENHSNESENLIEDEQKQVDNEEMNKKHDDLIKEDDIIKEEESNFDQIDKGSDIDQNLNNLPQEIEEKLNIKDSKEQNIDEDDLNLNYDELPFEVLSSKIFKLIGHEDIADVMQLQNDILEKTANSNQRITQFNQYSLKAYNDVYKDFINHTKMIKEMRKDLDYIFKKIRTLKQKIYERYPSAKFASSNE